MKDLKCTACGHGPHEPGKCNVRNIRNEKRRRAIADNSKRSNICFSRATSAG